VISDRNEEQNIGNQSKGHSYYEVAKKKKKKRKEKT
jgi:hypothetical protein